MKYQSHQSKGKYFFSIFIKLKQSSSYELALRKHHSPSQNAENVEWIGYGQPGLSGGQIVPVQDSKNGGKEGDDVADVLDSNPEPPIRRKVQVKRFVVRLDKVFWSKRKQKEAAI